MSTNTTALKQYELSSVPIFQKTPRLQHEVQMGNNLREINGCCDNRKKHVNTVGGRNVKAGRLEVAVTTVAMSSAVRLTFMNLASYI